MLNNSGSNWNFHIGEKVNVKEVKIVCKQENVNSEENKLV